MKQILIAHRGEPERWPENSTAGFRQALNGGARYIETDVQITADGVPILSHDPSLLKITGHDHTITTTSSTQALSLSASYPERFGDRFNDFKISTLNDLSQLLSQYPEARAFVEIKQASLLAFGAERVIEIILAGLAEVRSQCILISFDYAALQQVRQQSSLPIGWVLPEWDDPHRQQAIQLNPEYLFINRKRLPPAPEPLWNGEWKWVIYTLNEMADVTHYIERGFDLVETNRTSQLINTPVND
jgi:glycerophosphoryl diester phosphodiesterase